LCSEYNKFIFCFDRQITDKQYPACSHYVSLNQSGGNNGKSGVLHVSGLKRSTIMNYGKQNRSKIMSKMHPRSWQTPGTEAEFHRMPLKFDHTN
jgi:hypothetical protein